MKKVRAARRSSSYGRANETSTTDAKIIADGDRAACARVERRAVALFWCAMAFAVLVGAQAMSWGAA